MDDLLQNMLKANEAFSDSLSHDSMLFEKEEESKIHLNEQLTQSSPFHSKEYSLPFLNNDFLLDIIN